MANRVRISLANKCQLLFGAAVILILTAALSVVWKRMQTLVIENQFERARGISQIWLEGQVNLPDHQNAVEYSSVAPDAHAGITLWAVKKDNFAALAADDPFLADALIRFKKGNKRREYFAMTENKRGDFVYRFARAVRLSDLWSTESQQGEHPGVDIPPRTNLVQAILLIQLPNDLAERQLMRNRIYIVAAGLLAGLLAITVFWYITTRIILSPVRVLHDYAQKVSEGDLNIRADINTGDEFEHLSDMFNIMIDRIREHANQLAKTNKSLDLKLGELAKTNVALYEADKIKGEFLANVSHELRTPLNSIVGFAEVLQETLAKRTGPVDEKRKRYISNIISSSRHLLNLINELLDLAKIESGRMGMHVGPMSIADTAEGLINIIRPQAEKRKIELDSKVEPNLPIVKTDAGKVQQIIFNFLANAVKFTSTGGSVTLIASRLKSNIKIDHGNQTSYVRISVCDTGPGISPEDHERIFDKFTQLDTTVTKEHLGTGLGLTISRDLAKLLHGRIELDSDQNRGATFSLVIPLTIEEQGTPLMPDVIES